MTFSSSSAHLPPPRRPMNSISRSVRRGRSMRTLLGSLLTLLAGCHACGVDVRVPADAQGAVEAQVAAVAAVRVAPELTPCPGPAPLPAGPVDLPALWRLALANNPSLREAAAEVEVARGQWLQAGLYPNPRALY